MKKILIVDDSDAVRQELAVIIQDAGYAVVEAADGLDGLARFEEHKDISLVFSDLNMPRLSGLEFIRRLRLKVEGSTVPIIVVTADCSPEAKTTAKELRVSGWLVKPFRKENIGLALRKLLSPAAAR